MSEGLNRSEIMRENRQDYKGFLKNPKPFQVKFEEEDLKMLRKEAKSQGIPLGRYIRALINEAREVQEKPLLKNIDN